MKVIALTFVGAAVASVFGLVNFAEAQPQRLPVVLEGSKEHPILLGRMVVTATALP
jgi:hypothetical protein